MPEGRQSPPPENQSGKQQQDTPAGGQGVQNTEGKGQQIKDELKNLESNPEAPMDKKLDAKFSKGTGNDIGS